MPKLSDIRRIVPEDYSKDDQDVINGVAASYNEFADEIYNVVNGQLDFDNLARAKVNIDITFDSTGKPLGNASISCALSYVSMINIGKIQNITNSARITQVPFIDWSFQGGGVVKINYGVGFTTGVKYRLTLELIQ